MTMINEPTNDAQSREIGHADDIPGLTRRVEAVLRLAFAERRFEEQGQIIEANAIRDAMDALALPERQRGGFIADETVRREGPASKGCR
jgi:hypothetical protein